MKIAFYKNNEINKIMGEIFNKKNDPITCEVEYSENLDTDAIFIYNEDEQLLSEKALSEALPAISHHLNIVITSYDVIEVGDFGVGFAFFY